MVGIAVHNVFLNTLTIETPFSCVSATFQQWERLSHVFLLEITPFYEFQ